MSFWPISAVYRGWRSRTGLTQPAITQKLNRLEKELGCHLWIRRGRSIGEPTEVGRRFLHYTRNVLRETASLLTDIGILAVSGTFTLRHRRSLQNFFCRGCLLSITVPDIFREIQMTMAGSRKVCAMVENGIADVGFSGYVIPGFSGKSILVAEDRIVPVVSKESAIARAGIPFLSKSCWISLWLCGSSNPGRGPFWKRHWRKRDSRYRLEKPAILSEVRTH